MKSLKKALLLVFSLVMMLSVMAISASASETSPTGLTSIKDAVIKVTSVYYTGKKQTGEITSVTLGDVTLKEGEDYVVTKQATGTNTGEYTVTIEGKGKYEGIATGTFTIKAAKKTTKKTTVKATTKKSVKASTYKKKAKTVSLKFKASKKNKSTKITYKVTGGKKSTRKAIKVKYSRSKGKIMVTMPKGAKKGTYKIKVTLPAYNKYKKVTKTITIKVK